jgi:hypothetical protein
MRSDRSLCPHLAAALPGRAPFTLAPDEIVEWQDGPVEAVVRCRSCGACGWLQLVDRDPHQALRIFALAALRSDDAALYFRNRARGSCDVGRARAEFEALAGSTGPFELLVALNLDTTELVGVAAYPPELAEPEGAGDLPRIAELAWRGVAPRRAVAKCDAEPR